MARIDDLRPDQRAALQLLLQQGRTYEEIANLLRIEPDAVRERAHAALDALGPEDVPGLSLELQDEIADYLLGQQSASQRAGTRDFLQSSAGGRAWARAVSSELRPLAGDTNLPEIPAEAAEVDEAFEALDARTARREQVEKSSKVGGVILISAAVILLVGLVLLAASVLGGDDEDEPDAPSETAAQTAPRTTQGGPRIVAQINLTPPEGSTGRQRGVAQVGEQEGVRGIALIADGFAPARRNPPRFYAIWVRGAGDAVEFLGFTPPPDKKGRIATSFGYPEEPERYEDLIVTQESQDKPTKPGQVLLSGPLEGTPVDEPASTTPQTTTNP